MPDYNSLIDREVLKDVFTSRRTYSRQGGLLKLKNDPHTRPVIVPGAVPGMVCDIRIMAKHETYIKAQLIKKKPQIRINVKKFPRLCIRDIIKEGYPHPILQNVPVPTENPRKTGMGVGKIYSCDGSDCFCRAFAAGLEVGKEYDLIVDSMHPTNFYIFAARLVDFNPADTQWGGLLRELEYRL